MFTSLNTIKKCIRCIPHTHYSYPITCNHPLSYLFGIFTMQVLLSLCLLYIYCQNWLNPSMMVEAIPSRSNIKYTIDGQPHMSLIYHPYQINPTPYRISGVLVFINFVINNHSNHNSSCQVVIDNTAKSWSNTYALRSTYPTMIMVGNKNATIAAGCKSLVEVREAVTEFGRRLHAEYGYPRPVGFLYVTQEYSSHPVDDKSLDSLFTGMVLNQDKNAMDRLLQVSEPTVAVMEQSVVPLNDLFFSPGYIVWYTIIVVIGILLLVYSAGILAYLLYKRKLKFKLKIVPFLMSNIAMLCKCIEYFIIDYPFASSIFLRTGNYAYLISFSVIILLWSSVIASIDRRYKLSWMKSGIYGCYVVFSAMYCISIASFCSNDRKFRLWVNILSSNMTTAVYLILGIIFAYYTYVFYKNRSKYCINKDTVKALKKLTIVGALCFLTSIFRVISNIVYEEQSVSTNLTLISFLLLSMDIECLAGVIAVLWFLGPLSSNINYSIRAMFKRSMKYICHRHTPISIVEKSPTTEDKAGLSHKTMSDTIRSSNVLASQTVSEDSNSIR